MSKLPLEPKINNSELNSIKLDIVQVVSEETSAKGEIHREIIHPEEITVGRRKGNMLYLFIFKFVKHSRRIVENH